MGEKIRKAWCDQYGNAMAQDEDHTTELATLRADNERLRRALKEHACGCAGYCMDAKQFGKMQAPTACEYGRAAIALAQEKPND